MKRDSINRASDHEAIDSKNVAWNLLARRESGDTNLSIVLQRFESGGDFAEHKHDLEQFFYVTKGSMEMTIGGHAGLYAEGDFVAVERTDPGPLASVRLHLRLPRGARHAGRARRAAVPA